MLINVVRTVYNTLKGDVNLENKPNVNVQADEQKKKYIELVKKVFANGKMYDLLVDADAIHTHMCHEQGMRVKGINLTHIEDITDTDIVFAGEDYYGDTISATIPFESFYTR